MTETKISSYLQDIKKRIEEQIDRLLQNENKLIDGLMKSAVYSASGGKRVRAVFTHLIGELFSVPSSNLLMTSCAVELIHAASLIMDDLPYMDDAQLRRGKPSNHVVFGQDVALLASIGLLSKSSQIILEDETLSAEQRIRVLDILTGSYGFDGLAAGQFVDLKLKDKHVDFEIIEFINRKKTAALFTAAGQAAAIIGRATPEQMERIADYAENIGFAFQIVDDMLDIAGDKKLIGKEIGQDKMNFVKLVGEEEAKKYLDRYTNAARQALDVFADKASELQAFGQYLLERVQ